MHSKSENIYTDSKKENTAQFHVQKKYIMKNIFGMRKVRNIPKKTLYISIHKNRFKLPDYKKNYKILRKDALGNVHC